jgi:hypothetical protein
MTHKPVPAEAEITALTGHRFPGGEYSIEHWENFLLTGCTGAELMPDGMVHPVALFTSIAEMFELGQAESDLSIKIESYDWEMFEALRECVNYAVSGSITSAERCSDEQGRLYDRIQFCFEMHHAGTLCARTTVTWHYTRNTL